MLTLSLGNDSSSLGLIRHGAEEYAQTLTCRTDRGRQTPKTLFLRMRKESLCFPLSCLVLLSFSHFSLWFWVRRFGVSFPLPYFFETITATCGAALPLHATPRKVGGGLPPPPPPPPGSSVAPSNTLNWPRQGQWRLLLRKPKLAIGDSVP